MTIDQMIERERKQAAGYQSEADWNRENGRPGAASSHETFARYHTQLADQLEELQQRRAAEQDSLDAMCSQIEKVVRTERDDGDWYAALLRDGSWVHFHTMNDVLRRFIFDSKHCQHSGVTFSGQTEYTR